MRIKIYHEFNEEIKSLWKDLELNADITPTTNSGSDVPKAINDNPITVSETLKMFAKFIAELTNNSDP